MYRIISGRMPGWGQPEIFLSDQGSEFKKYLIDGKLTEPGVEHEKSPTANPESDGGVERLNRTLKTMVRCFVEENQESWDEKLTVLICAYSRARHSSTKMSPAMLNMSRQPADCSVISEGLVEDTVKRAEELALKE